MKIVKVESTKQVLHFLKRYDASAPRKISDRVQNITVYAEKLYQYGENYVVCLEGDSVGFFSFYNNDRKEKRAYLTLIALDTKYQRMKLGSQIMGFIYEECQKRQMKKICLEVDKVNKNACCFYKKQGFCRVGDASEYSYYMEKEL